MTNDLLRQRRNLLITSIGLLLFDFAHMSVAKVSILGTELLVGDPIILKVFAWGMWAYFLLRYYQYLNTSGDPGIKAAVDGFFRSKALAYVHKVTKRRTILGAVDITKEGRRWSYSIGENGETPYDEDGNPKKVEKSAIPLMYGWWWTLHAYLHLALHTPKVTDHILPFVLAIATPFVIAARMIW